MYILLGILLAAAMVIAYLLLATPYPFVWLLRSKKEEPREKGPEDIAAIKQRTLSEKGLRYPSRYPKATYDCYEPTKEIRHVLVWLHGGSFIAGSSDGLRNVGPMLADQGILVYAINYAHAPEYAFPTQLIQLDEFLTYLAKDLLVKKKLNVDAVLLGGDSAGANMVSSYATMWANESLAREANLTLHSPFSIKGLLLFCGPYDLSEDMGQASFQKFQKYFNYIGWSYLGKKNWYERKEKLLASPLQQLNEHFPPAYICDGKHFSFLWQGKRLVQELKQRNIFVMSRFYEDMNHEFQFDFVKNKEEAGQVFQDTLAFLKTFD